MPDIQIHYADDWAALYVDGVLTDDAVGDAYAVEEKAFALLGVKQVHDNAFMRGQNRRDGVARTLDEVSEYRQASEDRKAEAKRLRDEAASLMARAADLETGRA